MTEHDHGRRRISATLPVRASRMRSDLLMMAVDAALVALSFMAVLMFRDEWQVPTRTWQQALWFLPAVVAVFLAVGWLFGVYRHVWRYASVYEARLLIEAGLVSMAILSVAVLIAHRQFGPLTVVAAAGLATGLMGAVRFQSRLFARRRIEEGHAGLRVVLVGAGETGAALARQMLDSHSKGLVPVCFVDDDPRKQGKRVLGVPVLGDTARLADVIAAMEAHQVLLAVPTAPRELVQRVAAAAEEAGVALRVVPSLEETVRSGLRLQDVREVRIDDLLGREQVVTDLAAVAALLDGKRVLITGAGGSIGAEISRQVAALHPAALLLLDHDETHLHDVVTTLGADAVSLLVDIRERGRVLRIFEQHRPEVVFHAAAHKHVPILEDQPGEAVRTNVLGTQNVVDAARRVGVATFVLISTDKAVQPTSVMGASKRLAEQVVVRAATETGGRYTAVRFGNVLGSRGSVIPTFVRQIEAGGPVTVTDPRMTRYFMSIPEAVQLVLQAAALSRGGEVFMLEMGEPVRIIDLAQRMIRLSGRRVGTDVEIRVTGVRPGEKLEEQLSTSDERAQPTAHPSITRLEPTVVPARSLDGALDALAQLSAADADDALRALLLDLARHPDAWAALDLSDHPDALTLFDVAPRPADWELIGARPRDAVLDLTEGAAWSRSTS